MDSTVRWKFVSNEKVPVFYSGKVQTILDGKTETLSPIMISTPSLQRNGLGIIDAGNHCFGEGFIHQGEYWVRPTLTNWREADPLAYKKEWKATQMTFPCNAPYQIYVESPENNAAFRIESNPFYEKQLTGTEFISELQKQLGPGHYSLVGLFSAHQLATTYLAGPPIHGDYLMDAQRKKRDDTLWMDCTWHASKEEKIEYPANGKADQMNHLVDGLVTARAAGFLYFAGEKQSFEGEENISNVHFRHPAFGPTVPLTHFHGNVHGEIVHINMNDVTILQHFHFLVYRNSELKKG